MTQTPKPTSSAVTRADAAEQAALPAAAGPFVLNLCSSTTPMALPKCEQPELNRFSFFVSRRFEEGRERFRLHMGYFATLAEAEEWLRAVRDIYPGAWAGEAPGKKLRERAVAAAAAQASHAAGPQPVALQHSQPATRSQPATLQQPRPATLQQPVPSLSPAVRNAPTIPVARPAPVSMQSGGMNVPTLRAAPPAVARTASPAGGDVGARALPVQPPALTTLAVDKAAMTPVARVPAPADAMERSGIASRAPRVAPARALPEVGEAGTATNARSVVGSRQAAPAQSRSQPRAPTPTAAPRASHESSARAARPASGNASRAANASPAPSASAAATSLPPVSGVRAPIANAAQARNPGRPAPRPGFRPALPDSNVREVLAALGESNEETGETRLMPAPVIPSAAPTDESTFTDTQVLRLLETRRADGNQSAGLEVESGAISLLKPDDTGTRRALKQAITDDAPVWFAVQLQWSVQPVELQKVPPLAIFSAYTLYTVEGSRDGRKWYGLRLGFFSDAISAKQVAYYVRSEFTSVAVVPVSPQEFDRASDADRKSAERLLFPKKARQESLDEFKLIDSDAPPNAAAAAAPQPGAAKPSPSGKSALKGSSKRPTRVRARERRGPQTLEETLEILGASELEIDNGTGETLNESGVRHLRVEVQKNTPFSRLLERLSERVRKS